MVAGGVFLSWLSWISIQSLLQARLLRRAAGCLGGDLEQGRAVALHGRPQVARAVRGPGRVDVLWYHCRHQELRRSGKSNRWVTVGEEEELAQFSLETPGGPIGVADHPTEVQDERTRTTYGDPGGCSTLGFGRRTRTLEQWLPVTPLVTVVGRFEVRGDRRAIVRDGKTGLLLSPHEPGQAAYWETLKGWAGLLLVTACVAAGLWLYLGTRA